MTTHLNFTDAELEAAKRMKLFGLDWTPQPGDAVYDIEGKIDPGLPPIRRIYRVSEDDRLEKVYGNAKTMTREAVFLPSSSQAREALIKLGCTHDRITDQVHRRMQEGGLQSERLTLYYLLEERLEQRTDSTPNA